MNLCMSQHVPFECEGLVALITLVWSLRFVSGHVLLKVPSVLKSSVTSFTLVRFVFTVGPEVASQCRGVHESLLT